MDSFPLVGSLRGSKGRVDHSSAHKAARGRSVTFFVLEQHRSLNLSDRRVPCGERFGQSLSPRKRVGVTLPSASLFYREKRVSPALCLPLLERRGESSPLFLLFQREEERASYSDCLFWTEEKRALLYAGVLCLPLQEREFGLCLPRPME